MPEEKRQESSPLGRQGGPSRGVKGPNSHSPLPRPEEARGPGKHGRRWGTHSPINKGKGGGGLVTACQDSDHREEQRQAQARHAVQTPIWPLGFGVFLIFTPYGSVQSEKLTIIGEGVTSNNVASSLLRERFLYTSGSDNTNLTESSPKKVS